MAKIFYKEGCDGQNKLECIEGIAIDICMDYLALIYPKYDALPMIGDKEPVMCGGGRRRKPLIRHLTDQADSVRQYFWEDNGSPAARFVLQLNRSNVSKYVWYKLPVLSSSLEISYRWKEIDELASMIDGADLLGDNRIPIWSSAINTSKTGIACMDGDIIYSNLANQYLVVPTSIMYSTSMFSE